MSKQQPISQQPLSKPITQQPVTQPITQQPVSKPTTPQPITKPPSQPVSQPVSKPTTQQPITKPPSQPVSKTELKPTPQPLSKPTTQPPSNPVSQPGLQPVSKPIPELVPKPESKPTSKPGSQPIEVTLFVYDLSKGAIGRFKDLAKFITGTAHEAIYHTSIVVWGKEYYFSGGIAISEPGTTDFGIPIKKIPLGRTEITKEDFEKHLKKIGPHFTHEKYDVFKNNCNHLSNDLSKFLLNKFIPDIYMAQARDNRDGAVGFLYKVYSNFQKKDLPTDPSLEVPLYDSKTTRIITLKSEENVEKLKETYHKMVLIFFDRGMKLWQPYLGVLSECADKFPEISFYLAEKTVFEKHLDKYGVKEFPTLLLFVGKKQVKNTTKTDITYLRNMFQYMADDQN